MMKKLLIYFLCISFLLTTSGFQSVIADTKEKSIPIGDMVSRGTVKFETRENTWRNMESSHFPIFQGVKIKTEDGIGIISLLNGGIIEVKPNSLFLFTEENKLTLSRGGIEFRIPSDQEFIFRVGRVSISKARLIQSSSLPLMDVWNEEIIGSINIHPNGALTVKTVRGKLRVIGENQVVLASVSSKAPITFPSSAIKTSPGTLVAQVGELELDTKTKEGFLGLSTKAWVGIAASVVGAGAVVGIINSQEKERDRIPLCP